MKVFFILGRNPDLSRVEVLEFLNARRRNYKEILFENNFLMVEVNEGERFNIQEFGGVMWFGKIDFEGQQNDFERYLNEREIIPSDKFSYAVFGNKDVQILKNNFKKSKKIATIKHGHKQIRFQNGNKYELPNADFYMFYHEHNGITYFGNVVEEYDNRGVKNRDMNKPIRRESLAISPRLSKILINISGTKPHDLLLDPFCGVGGILQEALIKKINVYGIDKDGQAIIDAKKNFEWLYNKYEIGNKYRLENIDARKTPDLQFSAIATESPLGKVLRKKPKDNEAKQIITNFEAYIIPILRRLKSVKRSSAKIAITFPVIRKFHVDVKKIASKTGLKIYINPILESRSDQFISRDILVLK